MRRTFGYDAAVVYTEVVGEFDIGGETEPYLVGADDCAIDLYRPESWRDDQWLDHIDSSKYLRVRHR